METLADDPLPPVKRIEEILASGLPYQTKLKMIERILDEACDEILAVFLH